MTYSLRMHVRVLGGLEVVVGQQVLDLGGPKPRALLAQLVAAEGRPVPVEQLIAQIWGDAPPARVEASLQSYVARLRRVLEPDRDAGLPAQLLRTHAGAYSLAVTAEDVDARCFVALVREARSRAAAEPDAAVELYEEALALWRGDAYPSLPGPALEAEATRLAEMRVGAITHLWELRLGRGEHAEAVAELEQLTRLWPLREQLWGLLALALYRSSRQGDALATVQRLRVGLAEELGVDPSPELRRLEEAILRQEATLDPPLPWVTPSAVDGRAPDASRDQDVEEPGADSPLFGRETELAAADPVLAAVAAERGRTILLVGEPGVGKSRFADALARARRPWGTALLEVDGRPSRARRSGGGPGRCGSCSAAPTCSRQSRR